MDQLTLLRVSRNTAQWGVSSLKLPRQNHSEYETGQRVTNTLKKGDTKKDIVACGAYVLSNLISFAGF